MINRTFKICLLLLLLSLLFTSCSIDFYVPTPESTAEITTLQTSPLPDGIPDRLTPDADKIAIFANGTPNGFWARNDRGNGPPFNCSFQRSHAAIGDGLLTLSLTQNNTGYVGAEYRTYAKFSYGYYSVSMKAANCPGVISSFFTYTGWPWDEIDIEFLGDDTTVVQFNYYTNGTGGHEYYYNLGFDASKDFHEYGFDWQPDSITWYVDGKAVHQATVEIPSAAGHIMMNLWNATEYHELGREAAHHILYTVVNSAGMNGFAHGVEFVKGFAYYKLILIGWDIAALIALIYMGAEAAKRNRQKSMPIVVSDQTDNKSNEVYKHIYLR